MNIALEVKYSFEEYLEASRSHSRPRRINVAWYFLTCVLVLAAGVTVVDVLFWHYAGPVNVSQFGGLLVFGFVVFVSSPIFFRLMARKRWNMQPHLQKKIRFEIDPDLVRVTTETATAEMQWASFTRFVETKRVFLLYPNKLIFHMIPKRVFASASQIEAFRELARSKSNPQRGAIYPGDSRLSFTRDKRLAPGSPAPTIEP